MIIHACWPSPSSSACIDAGTHLEWMAEATDLDGMPRIVNGKVDMGAYESRFIEAPGGGVT